LAGELKGLAAHAATSLPGPPLADAAGPNDNQAMPRHLRMASAAVAGPDGPSLPGLWARGITHPAQAMQALPRASGPRLGLRAVLTRFVVTDLIETLPQALLGRRPFTPTRLPIPPRRHYQAQLLFLPAFGVGVWLLMGGAAHGLLRLAGHDADLGRVLDVVGLGMLVPMPPLWAADGLMLATSTYRLPGLAVTHALVQLWETALFAVGLHTVVGVPWAPAGLAGVAASGIYVLLGATLVR
jgi:hypothetical protein